MLILLVKSEFNAFLKNSCFCNLVLIVKKKKKFGGLKKFMKMFQTNENIFKNLISFYIFLIVSAYIIFWQGKKLN